MGQTQTRWLIKAKCGPEVFDLWHPAVDAHGAWAFGLIKHSKYSTTGSKANKATDTTRFFAVGFMCIEFVSGSEIDVAFRNWALGRNQ